MNWKIRKLAQRLDLYVDTESLPADLERALEQHADLRAHWEQRQRLTQLLAFKQYERPDPDVASRCRSSVIRQLRSIDQEESYPVFDWAWPGVSPAFRVGLAALFMAFVGYQVMNNSGPSPTAPQQADIGALPLPQASQSATRRTAELPTVDRSDFSVLMVSNWAPRVQQGGPQPFRRATPQR